MLTHWTKMENMVKIIPANHHVRRMLFSFLSVSFWCGEKQEHRARNFTLPHRVKVFQFITFQLVYNPIRKPLVTDQPHTHLPTIFLCHLFSRSFSFHSLFFFLIYAPCSRCRGTTDVSPLWTYKCNLLNVPGCLCFCQIIFRAACRWQQLDKWNNPLGCSGYENVVSLLDHLSRSNNAI